MPIIQSAIKQAKQNRVRRARLQPVRTHMKTMVRAVSDLAQAGKLSEAAALLPQAYRAVDMAAKKHIIHSKTASRKKSLLARLVSPKSKGKK